MQFFITATGDDQKPVSNKLGAAIVDRIVRAHENQENFHIIVVMPAVPAFPGDLKSDGALGTRAIMEFQYNSICRGGNSIIECVQRRGVEDWGRYLHFHNLHFLCFLWLCLLQHQQLLFHPVYCRRAHPIC